MQARYIYIYIDNKHSNANICTICIIIRRDFHWIQIGDVLCNAQLNCNFDGCVGDSLRRTLDPGEYQNTPVAEGRVDCRLVSLDDYVVASSCLSNRIRIAGYC